MMRAEETIWCDGCGAEITWGAIVAQDRLYCCSECAQRNPCDCGFRMEIDDEERILSIKPSLPIGYTA